MRPDPIKPGPDQESVWDYPRPPRLETVSSRIRVIFNGIEIANSLAAMRVLETSHPPVYYLPPEDIQMGYFEKAGQGGWCEWKGPWKYLSLNVNGRRARNAAWYYPQPVAEYAALKDHLAFYAFMMDECWVGEELATPQPGHFYGGWVTRSVVGPFKGEAGTMGW